MKKPTIDDETVWYAEIPQDAEETRMILERMQGGLVRSQERLKDGREISLEQVIIGHLNAILLLKGDLVVNVKLFMKLEGEDHVTPFVS